MYGTGSSKGRKTVDLGSEGDFTVKKGALHRELDIPEGQKIPETTLKAAEHSSNPTLRKRAISAEGLKAMKH